MSLFLHSIRREKSIEIPEAWDGTGIFHSVSPCVVQSKCCELVGPAVLDRHTGWITNSDIDSTFLSLILWQMEPCHVQNTYFTRPLKVDGIGTPISALDFIHLSQFESNQMTDIDP